MNFCPVQLAGRCSRAADVGSISDLHDLILFLIGTHHGVGRPFAPVVEDASPPVVQAFAPHWYRMGIPLASLSWSSQERAAAIPAHRLDSGVPARFWRCVRRYGWWGTAYLESLVRLSDWTASRIEEGTGEETDAALGESLAALVGEKT